MQHAHDQFLAHAGLAGDQHREPRARDEVDLLAQTGHGLAGAHERGAAPLQLILEQVAHHHALVLGPALERVDEVVGAQGRPGQGRQVGQEAVADGLERAGLQSVGGEHADQLALDVQRAAQARVHVAAEHDGLVEHQAVVGVGQRAVGREAGGLGAGADDVQSRVFAAREAPAVDVLGETVAGHRDQVVALEAQQGHGVAGNRAAHHVQQAAGAVLGRERGRHGQGQGQQVGELR